MFLNDYQFIQKKGALMPFLKRIFKYVLVYKKWFYNFILGVILTGITDAMFPLVWKYFIDNALSPLVEQNMPYWKQGIYKTIDTTNLFKYATLYFVLGLVQIGSVYLFIVMATRIQEYVMHDLRRALFVKFQELSFSFYDRSASGWLLSRLTSDTERVTELVSWGLLDGMIGLSLIVSCLFFMFIYYWKLALVVSISIPVLIVLTIKIEMLILQYSRWTRKLNSELTANYTEHINGVVVNKITAQENRVMKEFNDLSSKMRIASYKSQYYTALLTPLIIFMGAIVAAVVLKWGGSLVLDKELSIGTLTAFFTYATLIYMPILDVSRVYAQAQGSLSAGERIFSLLDEPITIKNKPNATDFKNIKGDICFKNVGFGYSKDRLVLQNFNLKIAAGESIALVGATGEGKSTIINLICRFYEPIEGELFIDNEDYTQKTIQSLRSKIGIVLQTPHLFSGTLRQNLLYGNNTANDETILKTLKAISAEQFILKLDEEVGENGDLLSMGEKQLISFARAILCNPSIIIMDEATANIDTITEHAIQQGIKQLIANRTAIIIAHRLSTIKNCDRILVIKGGKIIEDGSHKELMTKQNYYYNLYTSQLQRENLERWKA